MAGHGHIFDDLENLTSDEADFFPLALLAATALHSALRSLLDPEVYVYVDTSCDSMREQGISRGHIGIT